MFWDNFERICKQASKSPSGVCVAVGIGQNRPSNWKKTGTLPKQDELEKLADYLGCTVADFFKDEKTRENDQLTQLLQKKLSDVDEDSMERGKNILYYMLTLDSVGKSPLSDKLSKGAEPPWRFSVKGRGEKIEDDAVGEPIEIEVIPDEQPELDDYEKDFIRIYESLDPKSRIKLMNAVYEFDVEGDDR